MDKQTLSNYGWVIITVLVLAVMIALATPFGTYVKEGAKSTLTGLFESSENALNTGLSEAGVAVNKAEFGGVPTVGGNTDTEETIAGSATFSKQIGNDCDDRNDGDGLCSSGSHGCYVDIDPITLTWEELQLDENGDKYGYTASAINDTSIGGYAFVYCTSLVSITIPDSITSIGECAFGCCYDLASITIPNSVTNIDGEAFYFCEDLTSITIPNSVTNIGEWAFSACFTLENIAFDGTMAQWNAMSKATKWTNGSFITTITCTDGIITL